MAPKNMNIAQGLFPIESEIIGQTITQNEHPIQFIIIANGTMFVGKISGT